MAAQRPTRAHLDASDRVRRPGRLGERGITRRLATLLFVCQHYAEEGGGRSISVEVILSCDRVMAISCHSRTTNQPNIQGDTSPGVRGSVAITLGTSTRLPGQ